jgi:outer membrane murein-binding lipoprotein Lpp
MYTRRFVGVFALLIGCIALAGGTPQEKAAQNQAASGVAEAQQSPAQLHQQLIATAEDGRRIAEEAYRAGVGSTSDMLAWSQRWVEARLAAATNHQERLDALRDGVKVAQDREKDVQARQHAALATPSDVIAARYMRIQAELALANEK